jgi:predicted regulator of Ras-like GTPase activity (Roadblock/LC7/MglB family)
VDAATALADLTEISAEIEAAVVFDEAGGVVAASTFGDEKRVERVAAAGLALLREAEQLPTSTDRRPTRLEARLPQATVFLVRGDGVSILATASRAPASTLVFHDLDACLRAVADARAEPMPAKPRRAPRKKKAVDA